MPFLIPSPPSSPAKPLGLLGVYGSQSKGLYTATTFFWLFSRKQVPEVPSAANLGRLPALSPDWTLRTRLVISCGVFSKIWQGLMTPFCRLWALALAMMTMVDPASILQKSKKLLFSSVNSIFLQNSRISPSVRCVCLSLNFSLMSIFLSSAVRIQGKNLSLNFRPLKILSSKQTSIFYTWRFDYVFMSPGPESIRLQLIDSTRTMHITLGGIISKQGKGAENEVGGFYLRMGLGVGGRWVGMVDLVGASGCQVQMMVSIFDINQVYLRMFRRLVMGGLLCGGVLAEQQEKQCCGIVGMVMKAPITKEQQANMSKDHYRYSLEEFLCEGVELLKNRGYDSAGVFTYAPSIQTGRLVKYAEHGLKQAGCINKVVEEVMQETGIATSGIAHTRWATCGQKVDRNSHPHFDQSHQIYLVHNGIITNHASIKNQYLGDVKFTSSTDTEVIVQFLALRRRQGRTLLEALEEFKAKAGKESQWGLVIIDKECPDTIYTATNGSPLLIGFSAEQDEILVVSQRIAFQKHVNCFFPSNDHEVFELKVTEIPQLKQRMRDRLIHITQPQKVELRPPPQFKHWYNYEIRQQAVIPFEANFQRVQAIQFGDFLTMLACGSSYYAASASEYFFKKLRCFRKVNIVDPVQMEPSDITENQTVVLVSQSGETKDLISIVGDCKQRPSVKTIGIINVQGSTLARKVDYPIYIKVGRQVCVAATKSFFHQVLNIIRFATEVAEQKKSAPTAIIEEIRANLTLAPKKVQEIIDQNQAKCQQLAHILKNRESVYLLGKRQSMAIAKEAALKIKELNYIHAEAMGACEMKHGPIALIQSNKKQETAVILFVLRNDTFTVMMNALDQMHSRNAFVVVITDCLEEIEHHHNKEVQKIQKQNEKLPEAERKPLPTRKYHFILTIPHLPQVSHLLAIIPIQLFVEKMCPLRGQEGIDPDHPRNLAKSVTV